MKLTERVKCIPPYLFAQIDQKKAEAQAKGIDIMDLGIGDPDLPTPDYIVNALIEAVKNQENHNYPPYQGIYAFRKAVADWYQSRFGVTLDPDKEVISLIGSKEGIAHAFLTYLDPGDIALIPDPSYPAYKVNTLIAGGIPHMVPISEADNWQIDLTKIDPEIVKKAKIIFVNYPNNPTGAVATDEHLQSIVDWGLKHNILICMDLAYSEVYYDGYKPKSILQFKGAKNIAIEFHSLSKTFNMTGWRIGMAVGNEEAVQALGKIKTNMDSGIFKAVQIAGAAAFNNYETFVATQNKIYQKRRNIIVDGLNSLGANCKKPKASFYIWTKVPKGFTSSEFTMFLLEKTGILVVPGNGYGAGGEGYFRISITTKEENLLNAIKRLREHNIRFDQ